MLLMVFFNNIKAHWMETRDNMINYKMKCFYILISITPSLCQYGMDNRMKADVIFGDHNDRFDVSSLIRKQRRQFKNTNILDRQSEEYRRRGRTRAQDNNTIDTWMDIFSTKRDRKSFRQALIKNIEIQANQIANTLITHIKAMRRSNDGDFAYHDEMNSGGGGVEDFQNNLDLFDNVYNLKENVEDTRHLQNIVDKLHGQQTRRIVMDPENELLLHYALPVDLKIEGFLKAPSNE